MKANGVEGASAKYYLTIQQSEYSTDKTLLYKERLWSLVKVRIVTYHVDNKHTEYK